jgi:hypothetical protein
MLTPAQMQTLKTNIIADPILAAWPNNTDGAFEIAKAYNLQATPNFTLWKKVVTIVEVGTAMQSTAVAGLTTANTSRLQVMAMYSGGVFNPSLTDTRAAFDDVFSVAAGAQTRANLLALYKRFATRIEKLFAVGTGSDASPAVSAFADGFTLTFQEVDEARHLP